MASDYDGDYKAFIESIVRKEKANGTNPKKIREILYKQYGLSKKNKRNISKTLKKVLYDTFKDEQIDKDYESYPETTDKNFIDIISNKREFYENRNVGLVNRCGKKKFQLTPHQQLLGNFMTPGSIYKSVLLFHGTGTGKTCTAITIAENFRKQVKKNGKILVICGKSVENNFYGNIFDRSKLNEENLEDMDYQCTGRDYYDMTDLSKKITPKSQYKAIKKKIKDFYDIKTYYTFAMELDKVKVKDKSENKKDYIKYIYENFSNRVIIVDEVQALRDKIIDGKIVETSEDISHKESKYNKKIPEILEDIAKHSNNTRFVLLSATPMFNESVEILWLINLMRVNDNKVKLEPEEVFDEGELRSDKIELFKEYSKGYISYLRGEDPINFPLRLYPHLSNGKPHPDRLSVDNIPPNDFFGRENPVNHFEELKLFFSEARGDQAKVLLAEQEKYTKRIAIDLEQGSKLNQMSLLVCPDDKCYSNANKRGISGIMKKVTMDVKGDDDAKRTKIHKYTYRDDNHFLKWDPNSDDDRPLENYSIKFARTIESIDNFIKSGNKGTIFVYCSEIQFGVIPFCLALEHYGFSNYNGLPLLDTRGLDIQPISYDGKPKTEGETFYPAKYIMITGSTPINTRDSMIHESKQVQNMDGSNIRVIVGSDVMSEGIDLKWVREVHVLDPWYHLNKIEQIIGRGIRFCSHAHEDFPEEERNVTVFLHCIKSFDGRDTADIYRYREAWRKALQMGKVEKALKESAIDCSIHKEINVFDHSEHRTIKTPYAQSIEVEIKDKEYSKICSYGPECNFTCMNNSSSNSGSNSSNSSRRRTVNKDTYKMKHNKHRIKQIISIIRDHYKKNVVINFDILSKLSGRYLNVPEDEIVEIVAHSLNKVVETGMNIKHDSKKGKVVQKGEWYIFEELNKSDMPLYFRQHITKKKYSSKPIKKYNPEKEAIPRLENILNTAFDNMDITIRNMFTSAAFELQNKSSIIQLYLMDKLTFKDMVKYYAFVYLNKERSIEVFHDFSNTPLQYNYIKDCFNLSQETNEVIYIVFEHIWEGKKSSPKLVPRFFSLNLKNQKLIEIEKGFTRYKKYLQLFKNKIRVNVNSELMCWKHTTRDNYRQLRYNLNRKPDAGTEIRRRKHIDGFDPRTGLRNKTLGDEIFDNKTKLNFYTEMSVRALSTKDNKIWYNNLEYGMLKLIR